MTVNFEKVKEVIVEKLNCDPSQVKSDATFANLGADSLDSVELIMGFEEEFDIEIPDDEAEKIKTVEDVVKYIEKAQK